MGQRARSERRGRSGGAADMLSGGGELGERMRGLDWTATALGAPNTWPQSLRSAVSICLNSRFPIALYWGPELSLLYNDAWSPILGTKHPWALGQPGQVVWPEIWAEIGPLFESVQHSGEGVWQQDQLLSMRRHGYTEECYFNFTFSPIRGEDGGVAGIFNAVIETTFRVIEDRRARLLRDLSNRVAGARSAAEACDSAAAILGLSLADAPFCLIYLRDEDTAELRLAAAAGCPLPDAMCPPLLAESDGPWPVADALATAAGVAVDRLTERFGAALPSSWPEMVEQAIVVPLAGAQPASAAGLLVLGVSPRRAIDDAYHTFAERIAQHIATAIGNAESHAAERRRAEALATIDRTKTAFFTNISHEFRTPLTLLLGPLEAALAQTEGAASETHEQLVIAHRNALRLLKLVNTLLDFSRIEAGRARASFAPTDLAAFTADLASVFRSTIERAGLYLIVDCPPLDMPVYIDRDMWEKIVFNLLSNAFKFTFAGEIAVTLRRDDAAAILEVRDTGTGIPAADLPQLFECFHRVSGARGRTFEGSGIGLALVRELAQLHGGEVRVVSQLDAGTTFTVSVPLGTAHLPAEQIGDPTPDNSLSRSEEYVEAALGWLPELADDDGPPLPTAGTLSSVTHRVLLAEDNADMRAYVQRLLSPEYEVVAVADGEAALQAALQQPFDLVLSDVMMPRLDGFGLLAALRADRRTATLPVILLSARAGEEARVAGLDIGADDYLTKPFAAAELRARVRAAVTLAQLRRAAEIQLRASATRLQLAISTNHIVAWEWLPAEDRLTTSDSLAAIYGMPSPPSSAAWLAPIWADDRDAHLAKLRALIEGGGEYVSEFRIARADTGQTVWLEERAMAFAEADGAVSHIYGVTIDITAQRQGQEQLSLANERFRIAEEAANGFSYEWNIAADTLTRSANFERVLGYAPADLAPTWEAWAALVHPDNLTFATKAEAIARLSDAPATTFRVEYRVRHNDGRYRWLAERSLLISDERGAPRRLIGQTIDITDRKVAELRLLRLQEVSASLAAARDLGQVRHVLLGELTEAIGADAAALRRVEGAALIVDGHEPGAHISPETVLAFTVLPLSAAHPAVDAARSGTAQFVADRQELAKRYPLLAEVAAQDARQANAHFPLRRSDEVFAVLTVSFTEPHAWDAAERAFALALVDRAAAAYERARMFEAERHARERAEQLLALTAQLASALTPEDVVRAVLAAGLSSLGADAGVVARLDDDELTVIGSVGYDEALTSRWQRFPTAINAPLPLAARIGEGVWVESHAAFVARFGRQPELITAQSWIALPLLVHSTVIGAVGLTYPHPSSFSAETRHFAETLANLCAQALDRSYLYAAEQRRRLDQERAAQRLGRLLALTDRLNAAVGADALLRVVEEIFDVPGPASGELAPQSNDGRIGRAATYGVAPAGGWLLGEPADDRPTPAADALRSGRPMWLDTHAELARRYPHLAALQQPETFAVSVIIPLHSSARAALGIIAFAYPPRFAPDATDRDLMTLIAERLASALDRAGLLTGVQQSEERYRTLVEATAQVVWQASPDGRLSDSHARWSAMSGLAPAELPQEVLDLVHPEDRERGSQLWHHSVTRPGLVRFEQRVRSGDGGYRHWQVRAAPVLESDGTVREWIGTDTDITERKRAEEAIHEREIDSRFLAALADSIRLADDADTLMADAARTVGEHLRVTRCYFAEVDEAHDRWSILRDYSDAPPSLAGSYRISDIEPEMLQQLRLGKLLVVEDVSDAGASQRRIEEQFGARAYLTVPCMRGGRWTASFVLISETPRRWLPREIALIATSAERVWLAVVRLQLESEQRDHARRLQQLTTASLAINAASTYDAMLQLIAEEARTLLDAEQVTVQLAGDHRFDDWQPQGDALAASLTDSDGGVIGTIAVSAKTSGLFSATDRALLLQLAQLASVALENQTLYEQEQAARAQAEQASLLKDEFLATISHELRTPLTALIGYGQLIQRRKRDETYVAQTIDKMLRSARDQALIIDDLLDVSRIVTGKLRVDLQPIDLSDVVRAALDTVRPTIETKGIQLSADLQPASIVGDPNRLQQVVWNLLANAAKFTPASGVIAVSLTLERGDATLTVSDTGHGIGQAFLPFVFDRFRQADSTNNRAYNGLGLGLSIVRHLVELHGGTVTAASAGEGCGATFTIRLPLMDPGDDASAPADLDAADNASLCPPELDGLRVLVVDDQPAILDLLYDVLTPCGTVVRLCSSAREALATLRDWHPDVLLSDVAMPGEDGYWLIRNVRALAQADGGATPAIALTAYVRAEERTRVLAAGFQLYVPKPIDPDELRAILAHLVRMGGGER